MDMLFYPYFYYKERSQYYISHQNYIYETKDNGMVHYFIFAMMQYNQSKNLTDNLVKFINNDGKSHRNVKYWLTSNVSWHAILNSAIDLMVSDT